MANGWMKTLQCKSRAADDVHHHRHRHHKDYDHHLNPRNHQYHHLVLLNSANCRKGVQNLRDVVENEITKHKKPKQPQTPPSKGPVAKKFDAGTKQFINKTRHSIISNSRSLLRATDSYFPAITELQEGHPSRNVVEIIFHTSWGPKNFPGRIEMVFKVQNLARTVTRFEEYREVVKSRARFRSSASENGSTGDHVRCVADGNEVMRFHCLGGTTREAYDGGTGGAFAFHGEKRSAIRTFSETGGAHESAGGGKGRKAMLVCRVIAGRVCKQLKFASLLEGGVEYDSVSGENGEFTVFDSRALLPCFLVIYKL